MSTTDLTQTATTLELVASHLRRAQAFLHKAHASTAPKEIIEGYLQCFRAEIDRSRALLDTCLNPLNPS